MGPDDYLDDEDDRRFSLRSLLASGWFRAGLVLGVLVIALALTLPYALRWMTPSGGRTSPQASRPAEPRPAPAPAAVAPAPAPAPAVAAAPTVTPPAMDGPAGALDKPVTAPDRPAAASTDTARDATTRPPAPPTAREPSATRSAAMKAEAPKTEPAPRPAGEAARRSTAGGEFWVQVGAFQDQSNAERLSRTLRESGMPVQVARVTRGQSAAPSRHEVFVTGATVEAVNSALRGTGTARTVRGGIAVQPALELKDAVSVSRRLTADGMAVRIRRVGGDAPEGDGVQHVVRVGPYGSRAQAMAARSDLAGKGLAGFVGQGPAR